MPPRSLLIAAVLAACAQAAGAACFADYKAKRDDPLQLHYGVVQVSQKACREVGNVERIVSRRIREGGWQLLTVMGTFGEAGAQQRKDSAGSFYLRY